MDIWFGVAVGAFVGIGVSILFFIYVIGGWYIGDLREDKSSGDEKPYYFMEVAKGAGARLKKSKFVILKVKHEDYVV